MTTNHIEKLTSGLLLPFATWPHSEVPHAGAGVYSIWNLDGALIYVGMSGRGMTSSQILESQNAGTKRGLWTRLNSHASGARSGDQFCVYVADRLVLKNLNTEHVEAISNRTTNFDHLIRKYIHENLSFRFAVTLDGKAAGELETECRLGSLGAIPYLNPVMKKSQNRQPIV